MQTKVCARCHREQPVSEYFKRKQLLDGLSSYCKTCWKELNEERKGEMYQQQAEYREKNKTKRKKLRDAYYAKFKDEILARKRKRYHENKKRATKATQKQTKT